MRALNSSLIAVRQCACLRAWVTTTKIVYGVTIYGVTFKIMTL